MKWYESETVELAVALIGAYAIIWSICGGVYFLASLAPC